MTRLAALLALPGLLFACDDGASSSAPVDAKGVEEGALSDYEADSKSDSWRSPTEHGAFLPNTQATGRFADGSLYHAWTFDLNDAAKVNLAVTSSDKNLDTVAYLYRQNTDTGRWGRYIAKNDDSNGTVFSTIEESLEAGNYRLMVKGFKRALRGSFVVDYGCEGAGCPTTENIEPIVENGPYSEVCGDRIRDVLMSEVVGDGYNYVSAKEIDQLPPLQRAAAEWFISSALDWADEDEIEEYDLEIGSTDMTGGSRVDITTGADWSYSYLFDSDGRLLIQYFHDQSPYAEFFCPEGEARVDEPDEYCAGGMMEALPHMASLIETVDPGNVDDLYEPLVLMGESLYRQDTGLDATAELTWTLSAWNSEVHEPGGRMTIEADGQGAITYILGGDKWNGYVYFSEKDGELSTRCASYDDLVTD
jgi:hypothetical protein